MGEIKQHNFRIDSEKADAFRAFCEVEGLNQAEGFNRLMKLLDLDQTKELVPGRASEIEDFEYHAMELVTGYLQSIKMVQDADGKAEQKYRDKLESKELTILDLQEKIRKKDEEIEQLKEKADESDTKQLAAEKEASDAKKDMLSAEKTAADKEEIANMLQKQLKEAMDKLKEYPALKERNKVLEEDLAKAYQIIKDNQKDAEIAQERAVAAVQKQMDKEITALEIALSKAQALAGEAAKQLEKLESKNDKLQDIISELKAQIAELKSRNEFLEKQHEYRSENQ